MTIEQRSFQRLDFAGSLHIVSREGSGLNAHHTVLLCKGIPTIPPPKAYSLERRIKELFFYKETQQNFTE
jgi:hypothetical protein